MKFNLRIFVESLIGSRWKRPPSTVLMKRVYGRAEQDSDEFVELQFVMFQVLRWRRRGLFQGLQFEVLKRSVKAPRNRKFILLDEAVAMIEALDRRAPWLT